MGKVDLDSRINGESFVSEHLLALIIGERFLELCWHRTECSDVCFPYRYGVFLLAEGRKKGIAGRSFNECAQGGFAVKPDNHVALPVTGNGSVGHLLGTLLDGEHIGDFPFVSLRIFVSFFSTVFVLLPERFDEGFPKLTSGERIDVSVNSLVGNTHRHILRILLFKPLLCFLGRPFLPKLSVNVAFQLQIIR